MAVLWYTCGSAAGSSGQEAQTQKALSQLYEFEKDSFGYESKQSYGSRKHRGQSAGD